MFGFCVHVYVYNVCVYICVCVSICVCVFVMDVKLHEIFTPQLLSGVIINYITYSSYKTLM